MAEPAGLAAAKAEASSRPCNAECSIKVDLNKDVITVVLAHLAAGDVPPGLWRQVEPPCVQFFCRRAYKRMAESSLLRVLPHNKRMRYCIASGGPETATDLRPETILAWMLRSRSRSTLAREEEVAMRIAHLCELLASDALLDSITNDDHYHLRFFDFCASSTGSYQLITIWQMIRCLAAALRSRQDWFHKVLFIGGFLSAIYQGRAWWRRTLRSAITLAVLGMPGQEGHSRLEEVCAIMNTQQHDDDAADARVEPDLWASNRESASTSNKKTALQIKCDRYRESAQHWWQKAAINSSTHRFSFDYKDAWAAFLDGRPPSNTCIFPDAITAASWFAEVSKPAQTHALLFFPGLPAGLVIKPSNDPALQLKDSITACVWTGCPQRVEELLKTRAELAADDDCDAPPDATTINQWVLDCTKGCPVKCGDMTLLAAAATLMVVDTCLKHVGPPAVWKKLTADRVLALALHLQDPGLVNLWRLRKPAGVSIVAEELWEPMLRDKKLTVLHDLVRDCAVPHNIRLFTTKCVEVFGAQAPKACEQALCPLWQERATALTCWDVFTRGYQQPQVATPTNNGARALRLVENGYLRAMWITAAHTFYADVPMQASRRAVKELLLGYMDQAEAALKSLHCKERNPGFLLHLVVDNVQADVAEAMQELRSALAAVPTIVKNAETIIRSNIADAIRISNSKIHPLRKSESRQAFAQDMADFLNQRTVAERLLNTSHGACWRINTDVGIACKSELHGSVSGVELRQHGYSQLIVLWRLIHRVRATKV